MKTTTTVKKAASPKIPSGKQPIEAAFNKLQRAIRPGTIPADNVMSYFGMRLMQHVERLKGLAGMALEDGNVEESLEYEGLAGDLDALVGMALKHSK